MNPTVPQSYFEQMYAAAQDPWGLATRWYEQRKYACSMAVLPRQRYRSGFEPGCSVGVLSAQLAQRCTKLLSVDPVPAALRQARLRLRAHPNARVDQMAVPSSWPDERFDLVVVSELAYYLGDRDRATLWTRVADTLEPGGTLLAVHWRPQVPGYASNGDLVHAELNAHSAFERLVHHVDADFLLDVHQRGPARTRSVVQCEGLR